MKSKKRGKKLQQICNPALLRSAPFSYKRLKKHQKMRERNKKIADVKKDKSETRLFAVFFCL